MIYILFLFCFALLGGVVRLERFANLINLVSLVIFPLFPTLSTFIVLSTLFILLKFPNQELLEIKVLFNVLYLLPLITLRNLDGNLTLLTLNGLLLLVRELNALIVSCIELSKNLHTILE